MYALCWTQHSVGSQMIRTGPRWMQLLLGNIGISGGGMNATARPLEHPRADRSRPVVEPADRLHGRCRPQAEQDYEGYITKRAAQPLRPNQLSYWKNYRSFFVSLMKSWWGDAATAENNWGFDYLPKLDKPYDMLQCSS